MQTPFTFRSLIERSVFEPHTFAEAYEIQQWTGASGSIYGLSEFVIPIESSGTSDYLRTPYHIMGISIVWTDFFSGKYRSIFFDGCSYCGSKDKQYEFNLLDHPVCIHCGAEIA